MQDERLKQCVCLLASLGLIIDGFFFFRYSGETSGSAICGLHVLAGLSLEDLSVHISSSAVDPPPPTFLGRETEE